MFDIESGENVNESLATIKAGAHKVAGLAGSMGFQELGSAALKVDELVLRAMQVGQTNAERQHLIETIDRFLNCCDEAITTLSDDPI